MHPLLKKLYQRHVASSFDKQLHLAGLLGDREWTFDLETGLLHVADVYAWKAQVLGRELAESRSWVWAWADQAEGIPDRLLKAVDVLRRFGEENEIAELTEGRIRTGEIDGRFLAAMACGACGAEGYLRAPIEGGGVYLLICDGSFPRPAVNPIARIVEVFPRFTSQVRVNQWRALEGYARYFDLQFRMEGSMMLLKDADGSELIAMFDERGKCRKLKESVNGARQEA